FCLSESAHSTSPLFPYTTLFRSRSPAGKQHADDTGDFEHRHEPPGMRHADALRLAQQRRPPVEHRETDDIYEEIGEAQDPDQRVDRKSTRLNSSHVSISYAVFCL